MFVGVAPLLYDLLTSRFAFIGQLALLFTQGTGYFRLYAKGKHDTTIVALGANELTILLRHAYRLVVMNKEGSD